MARQAHKPTPRQRYTDAVWDSELSTHEKIVALLYARYAGQGVEHVWVSRPMIQRQASMGRTKTNEVVSALVESGWLVQTEPERQHRAARYRLTIPEGRVSRGDTLEDADDDSSVSRDDTLNDARVSRDDASVSRGDAQGVAWRHRTPKEPQPNPRHDPRWNDLATFLMAEGVDAEEVEAVFEVARRDKSTGSPFARLLEPKARQYRVTCANEVREQRRREQELMPRCEQHELYSATSCPSCWSEIKAGDRPRHLLGRIHTPTAEVAS